MNQVFKSIGEKKTDFIFSLDWWIKVFCILAACGGVVFLIGKLSGTLILVKISFWFFVPLIVTSIVIVILIIPFLIWIKRKDNSSG